MNGPSGLDGRYDQVVSTRTDGDITYFEAQGQPGGSGGNGGHSGAGGLGGNSGGFSIVNYRRKDFIKNHVTDSGLNGPNGNSGQPGVGGKYGDTAVRQVIRTETCRRRGGLPGLFGKKKCHINHTTNQYMTANTNLAASGAWRTTWNAVNQILPSQLNRLNTQSSLIDEHGKFILESINKLTLLKRNILNADDTSFMKQVFMQF